jgi:hypothetical protein
MRNNHCNQTHKCILGGVFYLFLSCLCPTCSEDIMTAFSGLHSLHTNSVNTFWHLCSVYNEMFLSSSLVLLCGFCRAAFKWWKWEISWGVGWMCEEWKEGIVLFPWMVLYLGQFFKKPFSSSSHARFKVINSSSHHADWERHGQWAQWSEWLVTRMGVSGVGQSVMVCHAWP